MTGLPVTIADAVAALEAGRTSSRELVEICLANIADPAGEGARTFVHVYEDQARAAADAMDALRRAGRAPGRLAGIPVSLKDLLDVAGETTRAGSVVLEGAAPAAEHAAVVARVLAAGMVPVGRTNMTEFAFSGVGINPHFGTPQAPFGRRADGSGRVPGGSSSGAAVSISDGMALAAIGTDTGGSCRIPAAFCGVAGFKPTQRRVPRAGVLPLSPTLDSVGPLGRTAACCAAFDAVLSGSALPAPPSRDHAGLRLVFPANIVADHLDAPTEAAIDAALRRLDRAGVVVVHRHLNSLDQLVAAHARGGFAVVEAYAWHRVLLEREGARYDKRVSSRILPGAQMLAADYIALLEARVRIVAQFEAELAGFDALIMPTVPIAPPSIAAFAGEDDYKRFNYLILRNPSQINFMDGCAVSIPCQEAGASPAGLTLAGPAMADARILNFAAILETIIAG